MQYLKCIWIFFLIYSSIECLVGMINMKNRKDSDIVKMVGYLFGCLIGGFWLFLLLKLI